MLLQDCTHWEPWDLSGWGWWRGLVEKQMLCDTFPGEIQKPTPAWVTSIKAGVLELSAQCVDSSVSHKASSRQLCWSVPPQPSLQFIWPWEEKGFLHISSFSETSWDFWVVYIWDLTKVLYNFLGLKAPPSRNGIFGARRNCYTFSGWGQWTVCGGMVLKLEPREEGPIAVDIP